MYICVIDTHTVIMAVYMDDILLASPCDDVTAHVKSLFYAQFCIKDMEPATEFLTIRIAQRPGVIKIDQGPYVQSVLKAASRVLNYLSQHPAVCIRYSGNSLDLHVYSDSDWGSNKDTRRSTSGVLIMMAGGPVTWMTKLQPIVTASSMEAEYLACFFAIQDVVWIRQLLKDIDLERTCPTKVFIDNQSARQLAMNQVHHQRSKHIDIKYHWIRDKVAAHRR